jgi:hypothetical protein
MVSNVEFQLEYVIISIFIGYMYYYLNDVGYDEIISWNSIKIGCISGLLLAVIVVLIGLLKANAFTWDNFLQSVVVLGILSIIVSILLVIMGGYLAVSVKRILQNFNR